MRRYQFNVSPAYSLITLVVLLIAIAVASFYADSYLSQNNQTLFFWIVIGVFVVRFSLAGFKKLYFLTQYKPESHLTDKERVHYFFKTKMLKQWFPVYNQKNQLIYVLLDVFVFKKMRNSPSHFPDIILKPLKQDVVDQKGMTIGKRLFLWNDMMIESLDFNRYRTVNEWLVEQDYDPLDDVEDEFLRMFKRYPELSFNEYKWALPLVPFAYAGVFYMTQLGPFSSLAFIFIATLLFAGITMVSGIKNLNNNTPEKTIFDDNFLTQFEGFVPFVKTFDHSRLGVVGKSVIYVAFICQEEIERQQKQQNLKINPAIDLLHPIMFQYAPQADCCEHQIQFLFNSQTAPENLIYRQLEKEFAQYLCANKMDYLSLAPGQREQIKKDFESIYNYNDKT